MPVGSAQLISSNSGIKKWVRKEVTAFAMTFVLTDQQDLNP